MLIVIDIVNVIVKRVSVTVGLKVHGKARLRVRVTASALAS